MSNAGDTRIVEVEAGLFHLYILGRDNLWKPIDVGGPGYLTPRMMEALNYRERY